MAQHLSLTMLVGYSCVGCWRDVVVVYTHVDARCLVGDFVYF